MLATRHAELNWKYNRTKKKMGKVPPKNVIIKRVIKRISINKGPIRDSETQITVYFRNL